MALIIAGVMTSVAAVAADATLQVILLTFGAALAFLTGGYLCGIRATAPVSMALSAHLAGARAVQRRLRDDAAAQKREWAGMVAELAEAQAVAQELARRNENLLAQLAHRAPPSPTNIGRATRSKRSHLLKS